MNGSPIFVGPAGPPPTAEGVLDVALAARGADELHPMLRVDLADGRSFLSLVGSGPSAVEVVMTIARSGLPTALCFVHEVWALEEVTRSEAATITSIAGRPDAVSAAVAFAIRDDQFEMVTRMIDGPRAGESVRGDGLYTSKILNHLMLAWEVTHELYRLGIYPPGRPVTPDVEARLEMSAGMGLATVRMNTVIAQRGFTVTYSAGGMRRIVDGTRSIEWSSALAIEEAFPSVLDPDSAAIMSSWAVGDHKAPWKES